MKVEREERKGRRGRKCLSVSTVASVSCASTPLADPSSVPCCFPEYQLSPSGVHQLLHLAPDTLQPWPQA